MAGTTLNPFTQVTVEVEKDNITYTYGGTVICTYTNSDNEDMVGVSLLNSDGVVYFKSSDVQAIGG